MTHTTVELPKCIVDISPVGIRFSEPSGAVLVSLSYAEFEEILEAVARTEKFNPLCSDSPQ